MSMFLIMTVFGILIFLILLSLLIWSIRSGQMDDLDLPADKILWEDPRER